MMKRFNRKWIWMVPALILAVLILAGLPACNRAPETPGNKIVLKVNGSEISIREFNEQIKLDAYTDPEMDVTRETRERFADYLVQRELMLQEAMKLELDKNERFVKTIERYWESTLIRNLLDVKTAELKRDILVNREEIEKYYLGHKEEFSRSFEEEKERIQSILEARQLEKKLEDWTRQLKAAADVTVNNGYINGQ